MTAPNRGNFMMAFLHRAGLFAGILAIVAGILGMHVITGTHSTHSPVPITAAAVAVAAPTTDTEPAGSTTGPAGHGVPAEILAHPQSHAQDAVGASEQCSCSGSCDGHAMTVACTPTAKTGSLSAPLPGSTVIKISSSGLSDRAAPGLWSYLPATPSPGELSISRT